MQFVIKTENEEESAQKIKQRENLCKELLESKEITDRTKKRYRRFLINQDKISAKLPEKPYTYSPDMDLTQKECELPEGTFLTGGRLFERSVNQRVDHKYQNPSKQVLSKN